jgi:tripartite-type tricarboxylate transporter receptor subunit TctC
MQRTSTSRRQLLLCSAALASASLPSLARAQAAYPSRPVRLVVPFGPGTSPDVIARLLGERLSRAMGQPVVIENRAGASTTIGAQAVATARPDGYTLLYAVNNTLSINPFIYSSLPYKPEDFVPVVRVLSVPYVLLVPATSPVRTLRDLVEAAKARPGAMTYGSYGIGQGTHVALARLLNEAGISMTHVPYRDGVLNDLVAGRIDLLFDPTTTAIPQIEVGAVRALAVSGPRRVDALPQVPTVAETLPGFVGDSWHGVLAPRGTPAEVVDKIASLSDGIIRSEEFRAKLRELGLVPAGGSPADFQNFLVQDAQVWSKVVKDNNIRVE